MTEDRLSRYKKLTDEMKRIPFRCGGWFPSMYEVRKQIMREPEYYFDFIVWLIETSDGYARKGDEQTYLVLERMLEDLKAGISTKHLENDIEDVMLSFDEYAAICDALGKEPPPSGWPRKEDLIHYAHRSLKENLRRFIRLDEYGPKPETRTDEDARRYVNAVLRNHLILT